VEFQGLQNGLSLLIIVPVIIVIFLLAWFSYQKYSSISPSWKIGLVFLRGVTLTILLFLIMNPFFKETNLVQIDPKVAVILDGSESTTTKKGNYDGLNSYRKVISSLRNTPENSTIDFFEFGKDLQLIYPSDFDPNQSSTNIYNAIETISNSDEDYEFAILVTDGIITVGKNPAIEAGSSPFPINVIAIGDTTRVKDLTVKNISTNATGFTNTKHQITVEISQFGFTDQQVRVNLKTGNNLIDSKTTDVVNGKEISEINFEISLNNKGLNQYEVEIEEIDGEWTNKNNSSSFSIEVLESKKRIIHVASAVHPDVKMLRSILTSDENIELSTFTYLGTNTSVKNIIDSGSYDLVIFHGEPNKETLDELDLSLSEMSTLYMSLPEASGLNLDTRISLIENEGREGFNIKLIPNQRVQDHPILDLEEIDYQSLPPLKGFINGSNLNPESNSLYFSSFQNIETNSPVVTILEQGNRRRSQINSYGWYKIFLSPNSSRRSFVIDFLSNIVDWTSSDPDNRLLKVKPSKIEFNTSESVILNASLINESGSNESDAVVEVTIFGENYSTNFSMDNLNNGNYELKTANLPIGKYSYEAVARKRNREIDKRSGEFLVTESNIELSNTVRNDNLLKTIALNSGGVFSEYTSVENFWDLERFSSSLESKTELRENYVFPVRYFYWFFLVIVFLSTEWLIRKKYALP